MLLKLFSMTTVCPFLQIWRYLILTKIERKRLSCDLFPTVCADTGRQISDELSGMIADEMKNHRIILNN